MAQRSVFHVRYNTIVIGGRVAGASLALKLAEGGQRVLVVDREPRGSDTLSTHLISRSGAGLLDRLGVLDALIAGGTPWIRSTTAHYGARRHDIPLKPGPRVLGLLAPRRTLLDRLIVERAEAAGAEIRHGLRFESVYRSPTGRVAGIQAVDAEGARSTIHADLVVGADGRCSALAEALGVGTIASGRHRSACLFGYFPGMPEGGLRMVHESRLIAGAFPTSGDTTCVFAMVPPSDYAARFGADAAAGLAATMASAHPDLAEAMIRAAGSIRLRRFGGAPGHLRRAVGRGWALVGDAGSFKDPCTAHGVTDALRDSEALSRAILRGGDRALAGYQAERNVMGREIVEISDQIAAFDWTLEELGALHLRLRSFIQMEADHLATRASSLGRAA